MHTFASALLGDFQNVRGLDCDDGEVDRTRDGLDTGVGGQRLDGVSSRIDGIDWARNPAASRLRSTAAPTAAGLREAPITATEYG
jgi:hypothetical protein